MTFPKSCGGCVHYRAKGSFDEEREENTVDIGLCDELDHVVWFFTPAVDCDYWEHRRMWRWDV